MKDDIQIQHTLLLHKIRRARYEYYELCEPTMSDALFDCLFRELEAMEAAHDELRTDNSPTQWPENSLRVNALFDKYYKREYDDDDDD